MTVQQVPEGLRVAVCNAMGGWGPYTVAEISELFRLYGFSERAEIEDVGGQRRTAAESFQQCIDWGDPRQRERYLMLIDDVLENYPDVDGKVDAKVRKVRRALQLANTETPLHVIGNEADLWAGSVRIFVSHLAERRVEVGQLTRVLRAIGFACFVAHDAIKPSRAWLREIERALRSCDILVAYVTPGFSESDWTDQEVGWALGRELVVIPVSVDGEMPSGFLGTYQAVRRRDHETDQSLAREISRAVVDAVFEEQRPAAVVVRERVAALLADAFCRVRSFDAARFWYSLLALIPPSSWTSDMRTSVDLALQENDQLLHAVLDDAPGGPVPDAVRALLAR
jgi:hypothetical protein